MSFSFLLLLLAQYSSFKFKQFQLFHSNCFIHGYECIIAIFHCYFMVYSCGVFATFHTDNVQGSRVNMYMYIVQVLHLALVTSTAWYPPAKLNRRPEFVMELNESHGCI